MKDESQSPRPRILLVEDSMVEAELLRRTLIAGGYAVTSARNGQEGLAAARAAPPDLVMSDIRMPVMNGYELCRAIKQDPALARIPVVLLSVLSEPEDIIEAINAGADSYTIKPYTEASLLGRLRSLLAMPTHGKPDGCTLEVEYRGKPHRITSDLQQMVNLLLSVYENTLVQNRELITIQAQLSLLNESLEEKVRERTAALQASEAAVLRLNAELEQRVEARTAELRSANAELESFAHAVSHDLRAPLRALSGFSRILLEEYGSQLGGEARGYLNHIGAGAQRMGELIDGLLTLSHITRSELRHDEIDLSALAGRLLAELARAEPERRVDCDIEPGLVIRGDARLMEVVMANLLGNAWKYTAHAAVPQIRFYSEECDGKRHYCVADNGTGFDMALARRLFQPFQRLHREDQFPGLGMGLATARRIIERHGGTISARAEPGVGATFCFSLPASFRPVTIQVGAAAPG